jgi:cytochrome P450
MVNSRPMNPPSQDSDIGKDFDPFGHRYLADPYSVFAEARGAMPAFYSAKLDYWVVTRYKDIREILPNTKQYSVAEALSVVRPLCPAGAHVFGAAQFDVIPTLVQMARRSWQEL